MAYLRVEWNVSVQVDPFWPLPQGDIDIWVGWQAGEDERVRLDHWVKLKAWGGSRGSQQMVTPVINVQVDLYKKESY